MKLISRNKLRELLLSQTQATIVSIVSCVEPKLKAKDDNKVRNPFMAGLKLADGFTICKVNKAQGRVDTDYQREVTNQVTKEIEAQRAADNLPPLSDDELKAELGRRIRFGTSWHRPIMDGDRATALSVNKSDGESNDGEAYLRIIVGAQGRSEYLRNADGSTVDGAEVEPFDTDKSGAYANQGAEKPREARTYKLSSIIELRINGEVYRVSDNFMDKGEQLRERVWDIAEEFMVGERKMATM